MDRFVGPVILRVLSDRHWKRASVFAVLLVSLFRAFPSYDALATAYDKGTWRDAMVQVDDPFADMSRFFPDESHQSKMTFRLTVPVLAHIFHLHRTGILVFSALLGIVLLYSVLTVAFKITGSRKAAFFVCLAAACSWSGETAFHELRGGYYDAAALCLLVLAATTESFPLTAITVFLAAWTDERALIASSFVFLLSISQAERVGPRSFLAGKRAAILIAWAAYLATRVYLTAAHSLTVSTGNVGLSVFRQQTNVIPLGVWTGLGGGWLLVACGIAALLLARRYRMTAAFCGALGVTIGLGLLVLDVTRSMAYCLPAVFVGLSVLSRSQPLEETESLAVLSGIVSLIVPEYHVQGRTDLYWLYPLPIQAIRWLFP
ncbi:MAG: hypothetical protein ABSD56_03940 [Bryobacteraceae bacterium]